VIAITKNAVAGIFLFFLLQPMNKSTAPVVANAVAINDKIIPQMLIIKLNENVALVNYSYVDLYCRFYKIKI